MGKKKKNEGYYIEIEFDTGEKDYFEGCKILEKKMKRKSTGSGCGMGGADVSFNFHNLNTIKKRKKEIMRFKWVDKFIVMTNDDAFEVVKI